MKKEAIYLSIVTLLSFNIANSQSARSLKIINTFHIASAGGWDYLATGPVNNWLYVSHGTQVNILNKLTGDSVGVIENTTGVHGIAFSVPDNRGFISNGRLNTVTVFDMNTNKVLTQIPVGQNPDAILYEPFSRKIFTCNGRSNNLTVIDPAANKVIDSIAVGGKPETAVADGLGKLYVNIEDKNEIAVVDAGTFKVINHWSILPGQEPTGLAIDVNTHRLFAGCDKLLMVINAENGTVVDKITIGEGCDGVAFDDVAKNIYTANGGDGTVTVIIERDENKFVVIGNLATKKGARTIAIDKQTNKLYLPTAEFEDKRPGQSGRAAMKPGTFQVLVIGK